MHTHTHTGERRKTRMPYVHICIWNLHTSPLFFVKLNRLKETMLVLPFPIVALTNPFFFSWLAAKSNQSQGTRKTQENACLPINEICANVQESARNLARGQKPRRERAHKKWHTNQMCLGKNACEKVYKNKKTIQRHADTHTHRHIAR